MKRVLGLGLLMCCTGAFGQSTFHGNVARTGVYESKGPAQTEGRQVDLQNRRRDRSVAGDR